MKIGHYKDNFAVLFHHFYNNKKFYKSPGSLTGKNFEKFIYKNKDLIIDPSDYLNNLKSKNKLTSLTFDDGLKCQYEIVVPILKKYNLKAFFFIPTSNFENNYLSVEIIRYLKYKKFSKINNFYNYFFQQLKNFSFKKKILFKNFSNIEKKIKKESPYYSKLDIKHKIYRDYILKDDEYNKVILSILDKKKLDVNDLRKKLFMTKLEVKKLSSMGHEIGLIHIHILLNFIL